MQKFIISVKEKQTGRDVIPPYVINSLENLGHYSERVASYGCLVIIDSIKEEDDFFELSRNFELSKPIKPINHE